MSVEKRLDMAPRDAQKLQKKIARKNILERANASLGLIARRLLPSGRVRNHYWISQDPQSPSEKVTSLSVNLLDGSWKNFQNGKFGNDVLSLVVYVAGIEPEEAEIGLRKMLEPQLTEQARED